MVTKLLYAKKFFDVKSTNGKFSDMKKSLLAVLLVAAGTVSSSTPASATWPECTIQATSGITEGTPGDDVICGTRGDDNLYSRGGNDIIIGFGGDDDLWGGDGDDTLYGFDGNDRLWGEGGNDELIGGNGDDSLYPGN